MREWQQTRFKDLVMPDTVYYQTVWAVRDLPRMEEELERKRSDIASGSIVPGGIVSDNGSKYSVSKPTERAAESKAVLEMRVDAIHSALEEVPHVYRQFIMDNIVMQKGYKSFPNKLWRIWKQKFLFRVAKNLEIM